jgi:hypothetical protein
MKGKTNGSGPVAKVVRIMFIAYLAINVIASALVFDTTHYAMASETPESELELEQQKSNDGLFRLIIMIPPLDMPTGCEIASLHMLMKHYSESKIDPVELALSRAITRTHEKRTEYVFTEIGTVTVPKNPFDKVMTNDDLSFIFEPIHDPFTDPDFLLLWQFYLRYSD